MVADVNNKDRVEQKSKEPVACAACRQLSLSEPCWFSLETPQSNEKARTRRDEEEKKQTRRKNEAVANPQRCEKGRKDCLGPRRWEGTSGWCFFCARLQQERVSAARRVPAAEVGRNRESGGRVGKYRDTQ